jgi:hypothetical protein
VLPAGAEVGSGVLGHAPATVRVVASDLSRTVVEIELGVGYGEVAGPVGAGLVAVPPTAGVGARVTGLSVRRERAGGGWAEPEQISPHGWAEVARVSEPGIWRDLRVVRLAVVPRPGPGVLVERVTVELVYEGTGPNPLVRRPGSFSPGLTEAQKALVLNHESMSAPQGAPGRSGARYLVLCSNALQGPAQTLADWRHLQGLQAAVYTLSAMGASNETQVRNFIQNAYDTWDPAPEYVVLFGDLGVNSTDFPSKILNDLIYGWYSQYPSDHWYTVLAGGDYFPDVHIGRIPVSSASDAAYVVQKIIDYERQPVIQGGATTWQERGGVVAAPSYAGDYFPSILVCKRQVRDWMLAYTSSQVDTLFQGHASDQDIINAVNAGVSFLNYRGAVCDTDGWFTMGFTSTDVSQYIHNGMRLPVVFSVSCGSGDFDYSYGACFGEYWLESDEANGDPKGAVAFYGSAGATHTKCNNWLDRGIFLSIAAGGHGRLGDATDDGLMYMYNTVGHSDTTQNTFREYIILGDPALQMWTDKPEALQVTHPVSVNTGSQAVTVWVKDHQGAPLNGALVCAWKGAEVYEYGYTMVGGGVNLAVNPTTTGTMLLTVTARNGLPYEGTIQVTAGDVTPPQAISDLSISLSLQGHVTLAWSEVTQDATGAPESMDHYEVFRHTDAYLDPTAGLSPIVTLPYGTTSYVDPSSGAGQTGVNHYYCVVAVDQAGNRSAPSNRVGEIDYGL